MTSISSKSRLESGNMNQLISAVDEKVTKTINNEVLEAKLNKIGEKTW